MNPVIAKHFSNATHDRNDLSQMFKLIDLNQRAYKLFFHIDHINQTIHNLSTEVLQQQRMSADSLQQLLKLKATKQLKEYVL